jgi:hypothetical protein
MNPSRICLLICSLAVSSLSLLTGDDWPFIETGEYLTDELSLRFPALTPIRIGSTFEMIGRSYGGANNAFYRNIYAGYQQIGMGYSEGQWLKQKSASADDIIWADAQSISSNAVPIGFSTRSPLLIGGHFAPALCSFQWERIFATSTDVPIGPPSLQNIQNTIATNQTRFILALKIFQDGDTNSAFYGWVELVRDRGDAVSPLRFGRHALDFIPNRAILAGREPERPVVSRVVTASGTSLSWEGIYTANGFALERAETLEPPVSWAPVEIPPGSTNVALRNTNSSSAFFRLSQQ